VTAKFIDLWDKYPTNLGIDAPCKDSKGNRAYENQCAIKMGTCFVNAGYSLAGFKGACCWHGHGRNHPLRVEELILWINSDWCRFTPYAEVTKRTQLATVNPQNYAGMKGIIACRNFWGAGNQGDHIDLWDGAKMAAGNVGYIGESEEVWFWKLN
jgi:Type VI secretion system (T6SS), amidase effector protein 4